MSIESLAKPFLKITKTSKTKTKKASKTPIKEKQGYQHSSLQNQYWSWRLEYYSFLLWIIHCITIKVRVENYNTQVSNSNIGFGDLNVDILAFLLSASCSLCSFWSSKSSLSWGMAWRGFQYSMFCYVIFFLFIFHFQYWKIYLMRLVCFDSIATRRNYSDVISIT